MATFALRLVTIMARKHYIIPEVPIHGIADRGKGVGRTPDGLTVFVTGAVPGDVVDVFVQKKKGTFAEGIADKIITPSPDRVEAFCQHFSVCGGCKWQNLDYQAQLRHKQQVVEDALLRIGKVEIETILPILGAPDTTYYRNKLEFGFANRRWLSKDEMGKEDTDATHALGFHRAGFFDKIIDIQHCWLQAEPSNTLRNTCRDIALEQELEFYDMRKHTGFLRNLMVRITSIGETMLLVSFAKNDKEAIDVIKKYLSKN